MSLAIVELSRIRHTNHLLHFILTLLTLGLWLIFWILISIFNMLYNYNVRSKAKNYILQDNLRKEPTFGD